MSLPETLAQIAVDLHDVQVMEPLEQRSGQRPEAGPDLDDVIIASGIDGPDDPLDDLRIDEKMLAEPLPRDMAACRHSG